MFSRGLAFYSCDSFNVSDAFLRLDRAFFDQKAQSSANIDDIAQSTFSLVELCAMLPNFARCCRIRVPTMKKRDVVDIVDLFPILHFLMKNGSMCGL